MAAMSGVVCIVTGASSGIGEGIAAMLAQRGAHVTLCGRDQSRLDVALTLCVEASGGHPERFLTVTGDLTEASTRKKIVQKTVDKFGRLDVLIPNAGVVTEGNSISNASEADFDLAMNVNVKSVFFLIQEAIPHLEVTKGNVVIISSNLSVITHRMVVYAMTKAAIDHMTRCLAVDLGPKNIRVNTVNPGYVPTRLMRHLVPNEEAIPAFQEMILPRILEKTPLGNEGVTVEAVAEAVTYLAGPAASFVTGQSLLVDAGNFLCGVHS